MKKMLILTMAVMVAGSTAFATDLNVAVQTADGASSTSVAPGETVNYQVVGQLGDTANLGIALVGFDLELVDAGGVNAGALDAADVPVGGVMANSVKPEGITNPDTNCPPQCGYGGTLIAGKIVQAGGGQNTINNDIGNAPFPLGTVITGIGHGEVVLLTGSLTAPAADGPYTLRLTNLFANVITVERGTFWATEAATVGTVDNLTINLATVPPLQSSNFACAQSLTRDQNHVLRFTFGGEITAPTPGSGEVIICALSDGGGCGPDLSADFTFTIEDGDTLRIDENGTVFQNETWYGIKNTGGWAAAQNFQWYYVVVRGDVSNNGRTQFADLSEINQNLTNSAADDSPYDIDANGRVQFADISAANQSMNSIAPDPTPTGHSCTGQ